MANKYPARITAQFLLASFWFFLGKLTDGRINWLSWIFYGFCIGSLLRVFNVLNNWKWADVRQEALDKENAKH